MALVRTKARPASIPRPAAPMSDGLCDLRFRRLLGEGVWNALPATVRTRFSKRLDEGRAGVFRGRLTRVRRNIWGWLLAQALRPFGAPLPLHGDVGTASVISVTEDAEAGGQVWTRLYANRTGLPQVIHSAKRFGGPTGLEEHMGPIVMMLGVHATSDAIVFRDAGYALALFGRRIALPRVLHPGRLEVRHVDRGDGRFRFTLALTHPLFGELMLQEGEFEDVGGGHGA